MFAAQKSRSPLFVWLAAVLAGWCAWGPLALAAPPNPKPPASDAPARLPDDNVPLAPKSGRSEQEEDRLTAAALFAEGRLRLNRQDRAGALRKYQRARRYDPQAASLQAEIVPLALDLRRNDELLRYAVLTPDLRGKDPLLLRRLAIQLSERGKWREALAMFEASVGGKQPGDAEISDLSSALLQFEIARLCYLTEQFKRSANTFARLRVALEQPEQHGLTPESVKTLLGMADQTWSLMGESFLEAKRYGEAAELFQKSHAAKADEARLAFRLARIEAAQDKSGEALKLLDEAFAKKLAVTSREPYDLLKQLLEKQTPDATTAHRQYLERLKQLRTDDAANVPLGLALAQSLVQAEDLPAAAALLEEMIANRPTEGAYRQLVEIQHKQQDWKKLAANLGAVAAKAGSLESLAGAFQSLVKDEAAVKELLAVGRAQREAKEAEPAGQARALGSLAVRSKQLAAAEECYQAALAEPQASKAQIWFAWGLELFLSEEPARAAEVLQKIVDERVYPANEVPVFFYLSGAYELAGNTAEALRSLKQGIARNPSNVRLESRLGWVQYHAKNYAEAEKAYREFIERFDKSFDAETRAQLRQARLAVSNAALHLDKLPEAIEWLEQVLDEFPGDIGALNDLGYLWAERGLHLHRALAMTHQAVAAQPENRAYRDSLGWAYYQLERYEEAAREIRWAAAEEAADGVVLDHLGDVEARVGRRPQALAAWQRAAVALEKEGDQKRLSAVKTKLATGDGSSK